MRIFFLRLWRISLHLSTLGAGSNIYPLCFQCFEISLRVPSVWSFCWHHFLWDISFLSITTTLLIYVNKFTLTNLLWHMFRVSWMVPLSTFLHSAICTVTLLTFDLNFTSSITTFLFPPSPFLPSLLFPLPCLPPFSPCTFIFVDHTSLCLSIIHLCKMSHRFTTGRQEGNTIPYLDVCVWTC